MQKSKKKQRTRNPFVEFEATVDDDDEEEEDMEDFKGNVA